MHLSQLSKVIHGPLAPQFTTPKSPPIIDILLCIHETTYLRPISIEIPSKFTLELAKSTKINFSKLHWSKRDRLIRATCPRARHLGMLSVVRNWNAFDCNLSLEICPNTVWKRSAGREQPRSKQFNRRRHDNMRHSLESMGTQRQKCVAILMTQNC